MAADARAFCRPVALDGVARLVPPEARPGVAEPPPRADGAAHGVCRLGVALKDDASPLGESASP